MLTFRYQAKPDVTPMSRSLRDQPNATAGRWFRNTAGLSGEVSVGDVVAVGETPLICASSGWQVLTGEVNEVHTGTDGSAPLARRFRLPGPREPRQNGDRQSSQVRLPSSISVYTLDNLACTR